jgi:two-component system sensor histidine kinase RegB
LSSQLATSLLAYDILQLAGLLYLTGGVENPFTFLLVAPVTVAAATVPPRATVTLGILAAAASSWLVTHHHPLPWSGGAGLAMPQLYKLGILASVLSGMVFLALYVWRLGKEARQMTDALAATEMVLAREQQLHALDGLAAAAAHELGTPLSTIAVVTKEMMREVEADDPLREDVELLSSESERCRSILARLTVDPAGDVSDAYVLVPLPALIEAAAEHYKREGIGITFASGPIGEGVPTTAPIQLRSPEIMQGIGNIVGNAVSFANHEVHIATRWTTEWSEVEVSDDGPGFSEALLDELGTPFISTRQGVEGHMGLGVFIAKTLLERTGATVSFGNRSARDSGAAVAVRWPNPVFKAT